MYLLCFLLSFLFSFSAPLHLFSPFILEVDFSFAGTMLLLFFSFLFFSFLFFSFLFFSFLFFSFLFFSFLLYCLVSLVSLVRF